MGGRPLGGVLEDGVVLRGPVGLHDVPVLVGPLRVLAARPALDLLEAVVLAFGRAVDPRLAVQSEEVPGRFVVRDVVPVRSEHRPDLRPRERLVRLGGQVFHDGVPDLMVLRHRWLGGGRRTGNPFSSHRTVLPVSVEGTAIEGFNYYFLVLSRIFCSNGYCSRRRCITVRKRNGCVRRPWVQTCPFWPFYEGDSVRIYQCFLQINRGEICGFVETVEIYVHKPRDYGVIFYRKVLTNDEGGASDGFRNA